MCAGGVVNPSKAEDILVLTPRFAKRNSNQLMERKGNTIKILPRKTYNMSFMRKKSQN